MKTLITTALALTLTGSLASAEPFEFEKSFASVDLDPSFHISDYRVPANRVVRDTPISLEIVNRGNPEIDFSRGDMRPAVITSESLPTSYDIFTQGNPEYDWNV